MSAASILITIAIVVLLGCYIINGIIEEHKSNKKYKRFWKYEDKEDKNIFWDD